MPEPNSFFNPSQSNALRWALVGLAIATSITLVVLLMVGVICDFAELRTQMSTHLVMIIGLAGMGMASALLVGIGRHQNGPIEVEGLTFKFKGGAGPVVLWIMAFFAMVVGAKMLWVLN